MEDQPLWPTVLERENLDADESGDVPRLQWVTSKCAEPFGSRNCPAFIRIEGDWNVVEVAHGNDEESREAAVDACGAGFAKWRWHGTSILCSLCGEKNALATDGAER
jgi:hypothetical protein